MTAQNSVRNAIWAMRVAACMAAFEFGRGLARLERGDAFIPALAFPGTDACCTALASFAPVLA